MSCLHEVFYPGRPRRSFSVGSYISFIKKNIANENDPIFSLEGYPEVFKAF